MVLRYLRETVRCCWNVVLIWFKRWMRCCEERIKVARVWRVMVRGLAVLVMNESSNASFVACLAADIESTD